MSAAFADTFYLLGLISVADEAHRRCVAFSAEYEGMLITTEFVLLEFFDGLSSSRRRGLAVQFYSEIRSDPSFRIVAISTELFNEGIQRYSARPDKDWSLTDCISFALMEREGIEDAVTSDHYFAQAGFNLLLK